MTTIDKFPSPLDSSPTDSSFVSNIFEKNPNSRFATGMIAVGGVPLDGLENSFNAYARLRAEVYIDTMGYLPSEAKKLDGTEFDEDDIRSSHFAVIENLGESQKVVATMRVIRGGEHGPLPIETFFPNFPYSTNHSGKAIEISRFISSHDERAVKKILKWKLYSSVLSYIMNQQLGPTYAVVDTRLERGLEKSGVPVSRITDPVFIEQYNSENVGILIDTAELARKIESDSPGAISKLDFSKLDYS